MIREIMKYLVIGIAKFLTLILDVLAVTNVLVVMGSENFRLEAWPIPVTMIAFALGWGILRKTLSERGIWTVWERFDLDPEVPEKFEEEETDEKSVLTQKIS